MTIPKRPYFTLVNKYDEAKINISFLQLNACCLIFRANHPQKHVSSAILSDPIKDRLVYVLG
jgi:hypothetical protein